MINDLNEVFNKTKDIEYGWFDSKGSKHHKISEGLARNFRFQSPEELLKSKIGICFETLELNRQLLKDKNIESKSYFMVIPHGKFFSHTLLVTKDDKKVYWIESSLKNHEGVHEYNSLQELFTFMIDNFDIVTAHENYNKEDIRIFEYKTPRYGIGCVHFYLHCLAGKNITKKYNNYI